MSLKEKVDGLMLLCIYFVPILVMLSWFSLVVLFVVRPPTLIPYWMALIVSVFFVLNGDIAPLLEVIAGAVCDGRRKLILYTPLLFSAYVFNVFVCFMAFLDLTFAKLTVRKVNYCNKTVHNGGGS
jgi:hypothetical protein